MTGPHADTPGPAPGLPEKPILHRSPARVEAQEADGPHEPDKPGRVDPRGHVGRFEHFARFEAGSLFSLFRRCLGDDEGARDLLQETLVQAWKHRTQYDASRPFRAWIFRIGQNRLRNFLRRKKLERGNIVAIESEPKSNDPSPAERSLEKESGKILEEALLQLDDRQRWAVLLRYQENLSCVEISELLETTPNAVSILLYKARKALDQLLKGCFE